MVKGRELLELRQVPWPSAAWILPTHCKPSAQTGPGFPPQRSPSRASILIRKVQSKYEVKPEFLFYNLK